MGLAFALIWLGLGGPAPRTVAAATPTFTPTPATREPVLITSPGFGAVLRGTVIVHGRARLPHATRVRLALGYGPQGPWFPLVEWDSPPEAGPLWAWDTTQVADGVYWLQLSVRLADGRVVQHTLPVQIRNRTRPLPTPTLAGRPGPRPTPQRTPTPTPTPWPTPPPLPETAPNAAALPLALWERSVRSAAALALLLVLAFALYPRRR